MPMQRLQALWSSTAPLRRSALTVLIQPQLRSFLLKGLETDVAELEAGCTSAYRAIAPVIDEAMDGSSASSAFAHALRVPADHDARAIRLFSSDDETLLRGAVDDALYSHILAAAAGAEAARRAAGDLGPLLSQRALHSTTLRSVSLVLGARRDDFQRGRFGARVEVGDHLHVLGTKTELAALKPSAVGYHLHMSEAQRMIVAERGLTARLAVDFELDVARAAGGGFGGDEEGDASFGGGGGLLHAPARETRHWVFESAFDGHFADEPAWTVVDMDHALDGNLFWSAVDEV